MVFDLRKTTLQKKKRPTASNKKRIVFMGSGPFALPLLHALHHHDDWDIIALVTKPTQKVGRGLSPKRKLASNALIEFCARHDMPIIQPKKFTPDVIASLHDLHADLFLVASYGKILPEALLNLPPFHTINVHTSLLPLLRGASPIHNAILQGYDETGVTLMQMDTGLDTGDIIAQKSVPIDQTDTTPTLRDKLSRESISLLQTTLPQWFAQAITPTPQDEKRATLCQIIEREDGHIVWSESTEHIYNMYRAFIEWPGIYALWKKSPIDLFRIKLITILPAKNLTRDSLPSTPGRVFLHEKRLYVRTRDTAVEIITLQRDGGKELSAQEFINGNNALIGTTLL